jgi:YbbR domain-containing protein
VIQRSVPIQAAMTGRVAEGYTVQGVKVDPTNITVVGPASLVEVMQFVRLAAFDVSGKTEGVYRHPLALDAPSQRIQYLGPASATVTVTIARQLLERRFSKRTVKVIGPARGKTEPASVDVSVTGPPEVINGLRDEMIVPRVDVAAAGVDLKEQRHGSIVVPVRVDLASAEIEIQPPTVSVSW